MCSGCKEGGTLLCCDYCPAAYHMQPCLNMSKVGKAWCVACLFGRSRGDGGVASSLGVFFYAHDVPQSTLVGAHTHTKALFAVCR